MLIVTAHQPAYLPWLGYIHKIALSDIFVLLDEVQFEKNSFTNRNKIWSANGEVMLTVPLLTKGYKDKPLCIVEINNTENWSTKHWKTLEQNYRKALFFARYAPWLESVYTKKWETIVSLTAAMLNFFLADMNISTKIIRQSELGLESRKHELVLDLCKRTNAQIYISGKLGRNYLDIVPFQNAGMEVYFQDYQHPKYVQQNGKNDFMPFLGVIDLLMNVGPEKALGVIFAGNDDRLTVITKMEQRL